MDNILFYNCFFDGFDYFLFFSLFHPFLTVLPLLLFFSLSSLRSFTPLLDLPQYYLQIGLRLKLSESPPTRPLTVFGCWDPLTPWGKAPSKERVA